jgi:hypothetical protein
MELCQTVGCVALWQRTVVPLVMALETLYEM